MLGVFVLCVSAPSLGVAVLSSPRAWLISPRWVEPKLWHTIHCTQTLQLLFIIFFILFQSNGIEWEMVLSPLRVKNVSWESKNVVASLEDQSFTFS